MVERKKFDVIIVGGSYAGLSAAMALGRALKKVLVIDSNLPCNRQTPHSHNFITQDGVAPHNIAQKAKEQVMKYTSVSFYDGMAVQGRKVEDEFEIQTSSEDYFLASKLIFATGVKDIMPDIKGFAECWGISVIHCPYCHGYEVRSEKTGILGNGDYGYEFSKMISNWTHDLTLYTNGKSSLTKEQADKLLSKNIPIVEKEIKELVHKEGYLQKVLFTDSSSVSATALYAKPAFLQHCTIPEQLGCQLTEHGHLEVDFFQETSVFGVYACGDNTTMFRSVANAVAQGNKAGAMVNKVLIDESF